jgi:hypothetical protein
MYAMFDETYGLSKTQLNYKFPCVALQIWALSIKHMFSPQFILVVCKVLSIFAKQMQIFDS